MDVRLRPLRLDDEAVAVAAHQAMEPDGFPFLLGYVPGMSWAEHVRREELNSRGIDLPHQFVQAVFLLATVDATVVGRASVRYGLNDYLAVAGGHIGYCVLPEHRRKGYATEILRQSLVVARAGGVDRVLLTCDEHNSASAAVIERCGGEFESLVDDPRDGPRKRRYWIP